MVVVDLFLTGFEPFLARDRILVSRLDGLLEQHVEEQVHRFRFDHQSPCWLGLARVEVLVDAVVVDDRDITCAPVVPDVVVDLVPLDRPECRTRPRSRARVSEISRRGCTLRGAGGTSG